MDYEILPQLIIVLSTAGILVIVGKNFSKIKEREADSLFLEREEERREREKFVYLYQRAMRRLNKENYEQKINSFWVWLEKLLRKIRISFLKLDHEIVEVLEHLRKKNIKAAEEAEEKEEVREEENEKLLQFISSERKEEAGEDMPQEVGTDTVDTEEVLSEPEIEAKGKEVAEVPREYAYETETAEVEENMQEEQVEETPSEDVETIQEEAPEKEIRPQEEAVEEIEFQEEYQETPVEEEPSEETTLQEEMEEKKEEAVAETAIEEVEDTDEELDDAEGETEELKKVRTKKEEEYIGALMKDPADVKSYWKLGLLYSRRRNYEDALACFKQIAKIDPTYTKAKQKAIELMDKMKRRGGEDDK